jgi:hypothetical protein
MSTGEALASAPYLCHLRGLAAELFPDLLVRGSQNSSYHRPVGQERLRSRQRPVPSLSRSSLRQVSGGTTGTPRSPPELAAQAARLWRHAWSSGKSTVCRRALHGGQ